MDSYWKLKCINPLNKNDHSASKNLSDFPTLLRSAFPLVPAKNTKYVWPVDAKFISRNRIYLKLMLKKLK